MKRLCALLAAGLMLASCTRGSHAQPSGSSLTIAQQREPLSLNPALENGASAMEWGELLFQYLVKFDDRGVLIGDAATAVPTIANGGISRDGRTIVYHLRPNLRFADGAPLTARDCVFSIAAILNPRNLVQTRYGYDRIVSAQAPNPATLVLHLRAPFAPLLTLVMAPQGFPILPAHLLASHPDFNHLAFNQMPIGSGPYVVTGWSHGDRVEMRANPYYYRGKPSIERLTIRFVPDPNTAIDQLRTGEAGGFFNDLDFGNYPILRSIPGVTVTSTPVNGVGAIIFNTQDPLTSDPRVRHALAEAIDVPSLIRNAYHGAIDSTNAGRGLFIWAYDPHAFPDNRYDPTAAGAALDAAGWRLGPDGVRHKNGAALDVLLAIQAQTPGDEIIGNLVADDERRIGVRVSLKAYVASQFVAPADAGGPVYGGKFQMALYPFTNGDDPDTTDQFACSHVPPNGYNKSRICDPVVDRLLEAGRTTYDPSARIAIYRRLQERLYDDLPLILLYQTPQINAFSQRVRGQTTSLSQGFWNVGSWYLSSER